MLDDDEIMMDEGVKQDVLRWWEFDLYPTFNFSLT